MIKTFNIMKTHVTVTHRNSLLKLERNRKLVMHVLSTIAFILVFIFSNTIQAQTIEITPNNTFEVKGKVFDENGPLDDASVFLKGTEIGTTTDKNGLFTFPKQLKNNDVLVISHLAYMDREITINKNNTNLDIQLALEVVEILGALEVDTPYKSKRTK